MPDAPRINRLDAMQIFVRVAELSRNLSQRLKAFMDWMAQILAPYLDP